MIVSWQKMKMSKTLNSSFHETELWYKTDDLDLWTFKLRYEKRALTLVTGNAQHYSDLNILKEMLYVF